MGLDVDNPLSPTKPPPGLTRVEAQIACLMSYGVPVPRTVEQAAWRSMGPTASRCGALGFNPTAGSCISTSAAFARSIGGPLPSVDMLF
jgi:hypothetical protein